MTYEELRQQSIRYADLHPDTDASVADAVEVIVSSRMPFPKSLAANLAAHIEQLRAGMGKPADEAKP